MKVILFSRRFNPGHCSHIIANYRLLIEKGFLVKFYLHQSYSSFLNFKYKEKLISKLCNELSDTSFLIIWFPSISALINTLIIKIFYKAKVVYIFHEPHDNLRSFFNLDIGKLKLIRIFFISLINRFIAKYSDKIILPSRRALRTYIKNYNYGDYKLIPLLYDDEYKKSYANIERVNISYIGTIAEDHAFYEFITFVSSCLNRNKFVNYNFLIATKSLISIKYDSILSKHRNNPRLKIYSGKPFSDNAINKFFSSSIVVWNAYKRSMQSGVLAKSYMLGTPVLISELNKSEFFINQRNGIELTKKYSFTEIKNALEDIFINFNYYSANCREDFFKNFFYKTQSNKFIEFING